jgi:hypothetical protein
LSELTRPVHVGPVLDRHDRDGAKVVVNPVHHAVVAASASVQSGKAELQRLTDPVSSVGQ